MLLAAADLTASSAFAGIRFSDNGDQTVTDNVSGLVWTKNADLAGTYMDRDSALAYVAMMNSANGGTGTFGRNDWRLPSANELLTLVDLSQRNPALPAGHPFIGVRSDDYWSSTRSTSSYSYGLGVNMYDGVKFSGHTYNDAYFWPVR